MNFNSSHRLRTHVVFLMWAKSVSDITNRNGYNSPWTVTVVQCKCNIRCEQLVLASVQYKEVSPLTCIICVKGPVEHYHVGSMAVWLDSVRGEPSYSHVISWTEWVQWGICAAVLYYRHNESQIRGTGRREGGNSGSWGRVRSAGDGGGVKMTPNTSVLSLSAAITPNHKHGHVQICLCLERPPAEMFPDLGFLTRGPVGIVCRLAVIAMFVRVTLTSTAVAGTSRWHKHVNHCGQLLVLSLYVSQGNDQKCFYCECRVLLCCCFHLSISSL